MIYISYVTYTCRPTLHMVYAKFQFLSVVPRWYKFFIANFCTQRITILQSQESTENSFSKTQKGWVIFSDPF